MTKRSVVAKVVMWVFFAIFVIYAITLIFPFVWCLMNTFKSKFEFLDNVWALPGGFNMTNWAKGFTIRANTGVNLFGMFGNSLIFVVGCTGLSMFSSAVTAYVVSKYRFPGRSFIYTFAIIIMMIPSIGSLAATYKLFISLKLYNTYLGILITSLGGFGSSFLLLYGYFKNISWSYAEAAFVDGAGQFRTFFVIMMPMALPALGAVGILQAIGVWNDFFTIYMYAPELTTIAVGLQYLVDTLKSTGDYPLLFSVMILSIIPIIVIFIIFQKTIMENTAVGGLKG